MKLSKLYDIAEKENIDIIDFKMKNKAIIGCIDDNYTIGINYSIIDNLKELSKQGYKYAYEFAEKLGVTEELIEKAYYYYVEGNYG